jgi:hypothetical protein
MRPALQPGVFLFPCDYLCGDQQHRFQKSEKMLSPGLPLQRLRTTDDGRRMHHPFRSGHIRRVSPSAILTLKGGAAERAC